MQDLNRQVVKSDAASFTIPELEFESPAFSQKGGVVENSSFFPVVLAFSSKIIGVKIFNWLLTHDDCDQ